MDDLINSIQLFANVIAAQGAKILIEEGESFSYTSSYAGAVLDLTKALKDLEEIKIINGAL